MELERLLSSLRGEGSLDSQGRFTIDTRLMMEKLARFQFADPHGYLLLLAAGLAQRGADCLEATSTRQGLRLEARCRALSAEELSHLLEDLAEGRGDQGSRWLALGVYAALRECEALVLVCEQESQATHLWVYRSDSPEVQLFSQAASHQPSRIWLELAYRRSRWHPWKGWGARPLPWARLRHAPYEVLHNGASQRQPFDVSQCALSAAIGAPLPGSESCRQHRSGSIQAVLGLGSPEPGLRLLVGGVLFECSASLPYRSRALVEASDLRVDLSFAAVVEDSLLAERVEAVIEELDSTLLEDVRNRGILSRGLQHDWLLQLIGRRRQNLPEGLLTLELLRTTQGQRKPIGLALRQQQAHGCVLVGEPGAPASYHGRFVFSLQSDSRWVLEALPVEVVPLTRTENNLLVPARVLPEQELVLPARGEYLVMRSFTSPQGRGVAGIPRGPCSSSAQLTLYVGGRLTRGKAYLLPPGLELVLDRPTQVPALPTAQELGPQLAPLYRELAQRHLGDPEVLTHLLAWLATAARSFNQLRRSLTTLEARLARQPRDRGIRLGDAGRELLGTNPLEALLTPPSTLPEQVLAQLRQLAEAMELGSLAEAPLLPTAAGARLSVARLAAKKLLYCDPPSRARAEPETLVLTIPQAGYLAEFLGPGRLKRG